MTEARAVLAAAMSEDELLSLVLEAAHLYGWAAFHVRNSKAGVIQGPKAEGFPDLVLARRARGGERGCVLYRELKTERGKLTPAQAEWGALLMAAGQDWGVWRPSDWPAIKRELEGPIATPVERPRPSSAGLPAGSASLRYAARR